MKRNELGFKVEEILETEEYTPEVYKAIDELKSLSGSYETITVADVFQQIIEKLKIAKKELKEALEVVTFRKLEGNDEIKNISGEGFSIKSEYRCTNLDGCVNAYNQPNCKPLPLIGRYTLQLETGFSVVEVVKCFTCGRLYEHETSYLAR